MSEEQADKKRKKTDKNEIKLTLNKAIVTK
jgi:hypothetical protein